MSTFELRYFNARGVVEITRIMFALSGQPYEDFRYPIDAQTWARPEFDAAKAEGAFAQNMDRLPMLVYNGTIQIGQSKTIERFVAKKLGFFGSNDEDGARIDMICEHIRDIKQKYTDSKSGKTGEALDEAKSAFLLTELPSWMGKMEVCLDAGGFAVGSSISLADISLYHFVKEFFDDKEAAMRSTEACPKIQASVALVVESAKAWLESRPQTPL